MGINGVKRRDGGMERGGYWHVGSEWDVGHRVGGQERNSGHDGEELPNFYAGKTSMPQLRRMGGTIHDRVTQLSRGSSTENEDTLTQ
jgi:hypothetical protein